MLCVVLLLAVVGLIEARPSIGKLRPTFISNYIIGGVEANPGEFPWQLSQQRGGSHSCGASFLGGSRVLTAAHCVDGAAAGNLRVVAGLHERSNEAGTQSSNAASYTIHEDYNTGVNTFSNDIGIINLQSSFSVGGNVQVATLPANNNNDYAGSTCVISGWGRTSNSNALPDALQKASIQVISTAQCNELIGTIGQAWEGHICLYDNANNIGSCNGDSGGPLNCENQSVVAGVTSWGISSGAGNCLQTYPSVYTRTGYYLGWINAN